MNDVDPITRLNAALGGRYRIERQLGEGGMAVVYLAEDLRHARKVALKVLKPELAAVVGAERFLAEIKTTANLQHPHILPLFDSGEADSFLFYVMPYAEGESLRERLDREHQLPVDEAVQIAKNVAEALDYAHSQGVIHRDIKPANILLQSGKPVVSDFGIALAVGVAGGGRLTETGLSLGTPHYMSPEQATGDLSIGAPTDIYALGCVLYEMLVGEPPFTGSTPQAVLGKIVTGVVPSAGAGRKSVPPNVDAAIRKALEKVPADRFTGAQDFSKALGEPGFRHGALATAGAVEGAGPWKSLTFAMTSVAMVAVALAAWGWFRPELEPGVPTRAELGGLDLSGTGWRHAISPDGRWVVARHREVGLEPALYIRSSDGTEWRRLTGTDGGTYPTFSPNGESVAFSAGGMISRVPITGGPALPLAAGTAPHWALADAIVYQSNDTVYRIAASGGEPQVLFGSDTIRVHLPYLLPSGEGVVFGTPTSTRPLLSRILYVEVGTGEVRELIDSGNQPRYVSTGHLIYGHGSQALMGVPFDADAGELRGDPIMLLPSLTVDRNGASQFALSETGTLIYADRPSIDGWSLVLVGRDGVEEPLGFEPQRYAHPHFSPDGGRLAVAVLGVDVVDSDLWVLDLARRSLTRVTFGGINEYFPIWTPTGNHLTFADGNADPTNTLLRAAADGSGQMDTLLARYGLQYPTSWSRDGRMLAYYEVHPDRQRDLWVLPQGGEPELILATPFNELNPVFSPDGRWLAYVSNRSGQYEVYVRPYPGPGTEVQVSAAGGFDALWSPDGSELFYRGGGEVMVVAVDTEGGFRPGTPRPLFNDSYRVTNNLLDYDIAPDGEHFVMLSAGGSEAQRSLVLVTNWFTELRDRMGEN